MDNHETHQSMEAVEYCRASGITLLTFPPHTTDKLQPLDVAVFSPFKNRLKAGFKKWISDNPSSRITFKMIANLASEPYKLAFKESNILSAFRATGILPFNRNIFSKKDFVANTVFQGIRCNSPQVPNPPMSEDTCNLTSPPINNTSAAFTPPIDNDNNTSAAFTPINSTGEKDLVRNAVPQTQTSSNIIISHHTPREPVPKRIISPEMIRPLPQKLMIRNTGQGTKRKLGRTKILTSTPEKEALEQETKKKKKTSNKSKEAEYK